MAGEWLETSLAAVMDVKHGFAFPGENIRDEPPGGILLTPGNFAIGGGFKGDKYKYFDGVVPADYVLSEGDLVVTMTDLSKQADTLGYPALVPKASGLRFLHNQRLGKVLIKNRAVLYKGFLYYLLRTADYRHEVLASATGTTVKHTSPGRILAYKANIPPLAEQKAIAAVLGALDDKIELNRRMNATLEAMARALFQSWFVDFDPVRAKLDGGQPVGLNPVTAALFPDSFQESEAGHIPKGWSIQPVGEVVECVGGGTPSTAEPKYWEGGRHHWTTPKDFSSLQAPVLLDTDRKLTDAGISKVSSGLLPAGTLLLSSRAPVGYLAIAAMPVAINQGFIALKCNDRATNFFMLNWCHTNMAEIQSRATGTTFAEISKQNFRPIRVVLPPKELIAAFTAKVAPLYAQITANLHLSRTLASLRDTLLPELVSGELEIADVDQILATNIR
jgi:type I restriction enzyme S subunit